MAIIGKINEISMRLNEFHWKISDFFSISLEGEDYCCSPQFFFAGTSWCLTMYPNGRSKHDSIGHIGLYLWRKSPGPSIRLKYCLGLKTAKNKNYKEEHRVKVFENTETANGVHKYILRAELRERKFQLMSDDVLTAFCIMKDPKPTENRSKSRSFTFYCEFCGLIIFKSVI